jgi:hypothetical protein
MLRRGEDWNAEASFEDNTDDQTDAMVKMLRDIAAKGRDADAPAQRPAHKTKAA